MLLKVEEVQGLESIDLNSINVDEMGEMEKKELIKKMDLYGWNKLSGKNYQDFNELLEDIYDGNEQAYWEAIGDIDSHLKDYIERFIDVRIESIPNYIVINPDGEVSETYVVSENGKYTFTIKEIDTGKIYQKSVEVTNIDTSMEYYYIDSYDGAINLNNKDNNHVEFQNAYIIYNGERIDVTSCIKNYDGKFYVSIYSVITYLKDIGKVESDNELYRTTQTFELIKDGESYFGEVMMKLPDPV